MNLWIDIPFFILAVFYTWMSSFLIHEFMHIKSQGIMMSGHITVAAFGMTCSADDITTSLRWYEWAGGGLSGILHLMIGIPLWHYGVWSFYIPIITFAMLNLAYGFYEGYIGTKGRFRVYGLTSVLMICFWIAYIKMIGL